jgi:hypothetical protein
LSVGNIVNGCDAAMDDTYLLMDDLHHGSQAIRGAGCCGDYVVLCRVILVLRKQK